MEDTLKERFDLIGAKHIRFFDSLAPEQNRLVLHLMHQAYQLAEKWIAIEDIPEYVDVLLIYENGFVTIRKYSKLSERFLTHIGVHSKYSPETNKCIGWLPLTTLPTPPVK